MDSKSHIDDAGIGAAARMGIEVYDQASRGSGRTYRMIMSLKEGSMVMMHGNNTTWMRNYIRELRGPKFKVEVVCTTGKSGMNRHIGNAMAKRMPIAIDHYLLKELYLEHIEQFTKDLSSLGINEHNFSLARRDTPPPAYLFREDWRG